MAGKDTPGLMALTHGLGHHRLPGVHEQGQDGPEAIRLQLRLASQVITDQPLPLDAIRWVAGVDVSVKNDVSRAAVVVLPTVPFGNDEPQLDQACTISITTATALALLDDVARSLYRFVWNEVCDWYLEVAKSRLYSEDETERMQVSGNLLVLLEQVMVLLHPVMPFVTEEIWHKLSETDGSIMRAAFPGEGAEADTLPRDGAAEATMELLIDVISGIRNIRRWD